ncbi:MAG TPA: serine protein kinase RIO, partial [Pseudomonas sp.]|nr:serine protein kinase RIO [Pseudomonas sp.]
TLAEQARREAMRGAEDGEPDEAPEPPWMKG